MTNGKSRAKGKRGELDVVSRLGGTAQRTGRSFEAKPDITTKFAVYSVKNTTVGGASILAELRKLKALAPEHNHYVVFKPAPGVWIVAELLPQHVHHHGDDELRYGRLDVANKPEKERRV